MSSGLSLRSQRDARRAHARLATWIRRDAAVARRWIARVERAGWNIPAPAAAFVWWCDQTSTRLTCDDLADANTVFQQWQVKASQAGILGDRRCIRAAIWLPVALLLVLAPALIVSGLWYITAFASGQASTPRALAFVGVAGVVVIICALYIPFITWVGFKFEKRLLVGPSAHTLAIRLRPRAMAVHGQFNRDLGLR